ASLNRGGMRARTGPARLERGGVLGPRCDSHFRLIVMRFAYRKADQPFLLIGFSILTHMHIICSTRSGNTLMAEDAVESAGAKAPAFTISTKSCFLSRSASVISVRI